MRPRRTAALLVATWAAAGGAAAGCETQWHRAATQAMTIAPDGEFRLTRFGDDTVRVFRRSAGEPAVEVVMTRGAILVKGVPTAEVWRFAQDSPWLMMTAAPITSALADTLKAGPCAPVGRYEVAARMGGAWGDGKSRLVGARGTAVVERPGEITFDIHFDTEPPQSEGRSPSYAGTLSYRDPAPAMAADTDVGGFSVVRGGSDAFVAPPGMTLAQLRARLQKDKP